MMGGDELTDVVWGVGVLVCVEATVHDKQLVAIDVVSKFTNSHLLDLLQSLAHAPKHSRFNTTHVDMT